MELIKIRYGDDSALSEAAAEKSMEDAFRSAGTTFKCGDCLWVPPMDMIETEREMIIVAEIAGAEKETLEVEISRRAVKISGRRCVAPTGSAATFRLAEIHYGRFERVLYLPQLIDPDNVGASYSKGFLTIRLEKKPTEGRYRVPISDDG